MTRIGNAFIRVIREIRGELDHMIEVVHISRSAATLRVGKRSLKVFGEGHALGEGSPGWVIYSSEVKWDPPYHEEVVDMETRRQAIDALTRYFASKENPYTVE